MRYSIFSLLFLLGVTPLAVQEVSACGGFFCNAQTVTPIYQAGERVVFAREGDTVTMHIEIMFSGEATDFGWILPIPEDAVVDEEGEIKDLEEVLKVSTADLFDRLQTPTTPAFRISRDTAHACADPSDVFPTAFADSASVMDSGVSGGGPPPVTVLQSANVGPYGAQLIKATNSADLFAWLTENGYLTDDAFYTTPPTEILDTYVQKEHVFLALKLQNGKSTGDLRPVELALGDTDACVPLRLTAIAATSNMPMLVWVLGDHRAIPKNFLHAEVNPLALTWPGATNYAEVVTEAVNSVTGRAFVTEYASPEKIMNGDFWSAGIEARRDGVENASTLSDLLDAVGNDAQNPELTDLLKSYVTKPAELRGYPYGDCWYAGDSGFGFEEWCEDTNEDHVTTEDEFYGYIAYWNEVLNAADTPIEGDLEGLKSTALEGFYAPRERIQNMFDNAAWITRFFTTISDDEMTRDPIFAYNPDLEAYDDDQTVQVTVIADVDCGEFWHEVDYPGGHKRIIPCESYCNPLFTVQPMVGADPLIEVSVMDESGPAKPFNKEKAEEVDELLNQTEAGKPTLPDWYDLGEEPSRPVHIDPPPSKPFKPTGSSSSDGGMCSAAPVAGAGPYGMLTLIVSLMAFVGLRRRQA
jgi:hypothetical protein